MAETAVAEGLALAISISITVGITVVTFMAARRCAND
jgi:hypothetical protein